MDAIFLHHLRWSISWLCHRWDAQFTRRRSSQSFQTSTRKQTRTVPALHCSSSSSSSSIFSPSKISALPPEMQRTSCLWAQLLSTNATTKIVSTPLQSITMAVVESTRRFLSGVWVNPWVAKTGYGGYYRQLAAVCWVLIGLLNDLDLLLNIQNNISFFLTGAISLMTKYFITQPAVPPWTPRIPVCHHQCLTSGESVPNFQPVVLAFSFSAW